MARKYPPRPQKDFTITCFAWELENEANHSRAGFPSVPRDVLVRRSWQFLDFLQRQGFTLHEIVRNRGDVTSETALRNSDLTDEGYSFAQRYSDLWVAGMHKDTGEEKEAAVLARWLRAHKSRHAKQVAPSDARRNERQ